MYEIVGSLPYVLRQDPLHPKQGAPSGNMMCLRINSEKADEIFGGNQGKDHHSIRGRSKLRQGQVAPFMFEPSHKDLPSHLSTSSP